MHLELMELMSMTQDLLSLLILWFYPESTCYLVDLIIRIVCIQHPQPRNVFRLLFSSSLILIVTYGLVKVHKEAHRPVSWIYAQLEREPDDEARFLMLFYSPILVLSEFRMYSI